MLSGVSHVDIPYILGRIHSDVFMKFTEKGVSHCDN